MKSSQSKSPLNFDKYERSPYRVREKKSHIGRGFMENLADKDGRPRKMGPVQEKILLLLLGGLTLGLTRSPKQYLYVARQIKKEWREIERQSLTKAIRSLYESKLVETKDNRDGTQTLILSKEGKKLALTYDIDNMSIKVPPRWDGKWRVVMFDVPTGLRGLRDTLRYHFMQMGFYGFQKSVFVHPHPCAEEIEYIMEFYGARRYVRFIVATEIDNALALKKHFNLV